MPEMNITVRNKIATKTDNVVYVCYNSDYVINFDFDSEWDAYDAKTAQFNVNGKPIPVVFTGNQCKVPVITNTYAFHVGVFAGDLHTTTAARVPCRKSILCGAGAPADPAPDVYDQLMERMAQLENPDWAQNDPSAKDYVKNRTHYVSRESVVLVPEQEVTTAVEHNFNGATLNDVDSDAFETLYDSEDDTTFDVVFDGTSYPCKLLEQAGSRIPVFGNLAIVKPSVTDTGEPFCVEFVPESTFAIACKVAGTHTVAVSYQQDVVHTLDPKYIQDMYYAETRESVVATGLSGWSLTTADLPDRVIPKVRINGTIYENVPPLSYSTELIIVYQIGDYEVTFLTQYDRVSISPDNTISADDIEFLGSVTTYHQIAEEYLPGYTALKTDVANAKRVANLVVTFSEYYKDSALQFKNIPDARAIFVSPSGGGTKLSAKRYTYDNKTYYDILSCKTGVAITDAEIPYGTMVLSIVSTGKCYLLNPL